jgi:hypothetical protein
MSPSCHPTYLHVPPHSPPLTTEPRACQLQQVPLLKQWANTFPLKVINDLYWYRDRLVVVDDLPLRRGVISLYHNSPTAGHLGISNTTWAIAWDYWWPNMKQTIMEYVKGCHLCQSWKNNPTKPKPPLFPIPSDNFTLPFTSVSMDFIVKLPISEGYDSILTITDTFSKACIFIPCNKTIDAVGTALLYATYVLPHYGLPSRFISDCDPCFMATIIQELCHILSIQHNASTAYRPQTDGQSEHSNQKLEQYTHIFTNFHQTNWCSLLPLAQFAFNAWPNTTTKKAPFELIMGHIPCIHQTFRTTTSPPLNDRLALISQARKDTAEALHRSQALELPSNFIPYCVGDCVWLEGKNLNTTHPSAKLVPRRYRPFLVMSAISRTSFHLKLPPTWHIHNVFHRTLLTPYKETALNGNKYQELAPDLVDGQPKWEVEQILDARKRRQQLQYLVRWKGFSEAHDSWEPLSHINADQLIQKFYHNHPTAIRSTYKASPLPPTITIRSITMSSPLSPLSPSPSPEENLVYPTSPPGLPIPPPLIERITNPPAPLPLAQHISSVTLKEAIAACKEELGDRPMAHYNDPWRTPMHHDPPPPPAPLGQLAPTSYVKYEAGDPNHDCYICKIMISPPFGTPQTPHYVCFDLNFDSHQHYGLGLCNDSIPLLEAYGWLLEATPFIGLCLSSGVSDNKALGIFDAGYPGAVEVDVALFELRDYGIMAHIDRYRSHMMEYKTLLEEKRLSAWRTKAQGPCQWLIKAQARNRLHPYLFQGEHITCPLAFCTAPIPTPQSLTMAQCTKIDAEAGELESGCPWFEDHWGVKYTFPAHPFRCRCTYCHGADHLPTKCDCPHSKCYTTPWCIIPHCHAHYGPACHAHYLHLVEVPLPAEANPALEDEGYVGHEDKEGNRES